MKHWNCSTKGICCYQSSTHSLPNQQPEDSDQLIQWVRSGVLLLGCKKNLQPQGSLWNDLWQKWHRHCLKGLLLIFWLCLIGKRRLPGRKLFHVGWCLSLSQHQLSLPLWVSGSWLKRTSANICPFLTFVFFWLNLAEWARSVILNWQLTTTVWRTDPASRPPGLKPGWRTQKVLNRWRTSELLKHQNRCFTQTLLTLHYSATILLTFQTEVYWLPCNLWSAGDP